MSAERKALTELVAALHATDVDRTARAVVAAEEALAQPTAPASPLTTINADALAHFTDYFVRNYPGPSTIISDPKWHAPKLFRAAQYAIEQASPPQAQPDAHPSAQPVAWRAKHTPFPSPTWSSGAPTPAETAYWTKNADGVELAYSAPPPQAQPDPTHEFFRRETAAHWQPTAPLSAQPQGTGVEAAIETLVDALAVSKGWARTYADSIIRDAIDRTHLSAQPVAEVHRNEAGQIMLRAPDGGVFDVSQHVGARLYTTPPTPADARPEMQGWVWMTHPTRLKGQPIPVRFLTHSDGTREYQPFDDDATAFDVALMSSDWKRVKPTDARGSEALWEASQKARKALQAFLDHHRGGHRPYYEKCLAMAIDAAATLDAALAASQAAPAQQEPKT